VYIDGISIRIVNITNVTYERGSSFFQLSSDGTDFTNFIARNIGTFNLQTSSSYWDPIRADPLAQTYLPMNFISIIFYQYVSYKTTNISPIATAFLKIDNSIFENIEPR
jgi:hypothetical protein